MDPITGAVRDRGDDAASFGPFDRVPAEPVLRHRAVLVRRVQAPWQGGLGGATQCPPDGCRRHSKRWGIGGVMQYSPIARQRRAGVKGQRPLRSRVASATRNCAFPKNGQRFISRFCDVGQVRFVMVR